MTDAFSNAGGGGVRHLLCQPYDLIDQSADAREHFERRRIAHVCRRGDDPIGRIHEGFGDGLCDVHRAHGLRRGGRVVPCVRAKRDRARLPHLSPKDRRRYFFEFDFDDLTRADNAARYAALQIALQNGLKSRNEGRREENLNPVEGGDLFTISQNVQLLDKKGMPLPPPAAPAAPAAPEPAAATTPPTP